MRHTAELFLVVGRTIEEQRHFAIRTQPIEVRRSLKLRRIVAGDGNADHSVCSTARCDPWLPVIRLSQPASLEPRTTQAWESRNDRRLCRLRQTVARRGIL